jgi:hypothetical protein
MPTSADFWSKICVKFRYFILINNVIGIFQVRLINPEKVIHDFFSESRRKILTQKHGFARFIAARHFLAIKKGRTSCAA